MVKGSNYGKFKRNLQPIKVVKIKCTATTIGGESSAVDAVIGYNKINQLSGNGLTSANLYELAKKLRTETTDIYGNKFVYEILNETEVPVETTTSSTNPSS